MNYEDIIQYIDAQLSSNQVTETQEIQPSSLIDATNQNVLNMIALEINRKGGY